MSFQKYPFFACLFGAILLCTAGYSRADEAEITGIGGNVAMLSGQQNVSMVSEVVKIKLPEGKVSALFVFKNNGPAATVEMGFPEASTDFNPELHDGVLTTMQDFQSLLDGKPISVKRTQTARRIGAGQYRVWWVKRVHFAPGQIHKIHDTYTGGLAYLDPDGYVGFHYILRSGASWQGAIGKATIFCDISGLKNHGPTYYQPAIGKRTDHVITWRLTNIRPQSDIVVAWMNPFSAVSVNGKPVWVPDSHGMANVGTDTAPRMELDPFQFAWPSGEWGGLGARKVGNDVIVSAKTASYWLDATLTIGDRGYVTKIARKGHSVLIAPNYHTLVAWGGGRKSFDTSPGGKPLFEGAQYFNGDSSPETNGYTALYLRRLVTALGGTSEWDTRLNRLKITLPDSETVTPITVAPPVPQSVTPIAPPVPEAMPLPVPTQTPSPEPPATDGSSPHTVGM